MRGRRVKVHHHAVGYAMKKGVALAHAAEGRNGPAAAWAAHVVALADGRTPTRLNGRSVEDVRGPEWGAWKSVQASVHG